MDGVMDGRITTCAELDVDFRDVESGAGVVGSEPESVGFVLAARVQHFERVPAGLEESRRIIFNRPAVQSQGNFSVCILPIHLNQAVSI